MGGDQLVAVVRRVEVQQMILLAQDLAALVQLAHADAHVVLFRVVSGIDQLPGFQMDAVDLGQGR